MSSCCSLTTGTDADRPFAMRIVARACLSGSDPDVVRDAHELAARLGPIATNSAAPIQYEPCPVCQAPIPFHDAATAKCPNGHVWGESAVRLPSMSKGLTHPARLQLAAQ